jgi:hypothetical protein
VAGGDVDPLLGAADGLDQHVGDAVAAVAGEAVAHRVEVVAGEVDVRAGVLGDHLLRDLLGGDVADDLRVGGQVPRVRPEVVELALEAQRELRVRLEEEGVLVVLGRGAVRPVAAARDQLRLLGEGHVLARAVDDGELVVHDLVHPAHVDAGRLEPPALGGGERVSGHLAVLAGGLEEEAHLDPAGDGLAQRGADVGVGVAVHRDVDGPLRPADGLGDERVVALLDRLRGEDDRARLALLGLQVALRLGGGLELPQRRRPDLRHRVELGDGVEEVVVLGALRTVLAVAVADDVARATRVDPRRGLEAGAGERAVVDHREHRQRRRRSLAQALDLVALRRRGVVASVAAGHADQRQDREQREGPELGSRHGTALSRRRATTTV